MNRVAAVLATAGLTVASLLTTIAPAEAAPKWALCNQGGAGVASTETLQYRHTKRGKVHFVRADTCKTLTDGTIYVGYYRNKGMEIQRWPSNPKCYKTGKGVSMKELKPGKSPWVFITPRVKKNCSS